MSNDTHKGRILGYDHITLWVGNAKQAATYYCVHLGFRPYAYRGLENGSQDVVSHVVKQNDIVIELQSPLTPGHYMTHSLTRHGDGVKDVAFAVDDVVAVLERARRNGAVVLSELEEKGDKSTGTVRMATIKAFGDTTHTFVERLGFSGHYLPDYTESPIRLSILSNVPEVDLKYLDHSVLNHPMDTISAAVEWYERCLGLTKFWSVDETQIHTELSSLRSVVLTNWDTSLKYLCAEPAPGKRKSQIQEYLDYYDGPGIQHLAFNSFNIIKDVRAMKARGLQFQTTNKTYYKQLRERLKTAKVTVTENMDAIEELNILVDFDDTGYLLQIFTKPVQDRPTLFLEIIQRHNHNGFGVGNIKALFESIEEDQKLRGNLNVCETPVKQSFPQSIPCHRKGKCHPSRVGRFVKPINDLKSVGALDVEQSIRCKLAAVYRVVERNGWSEGIYNHITARISEDSEQFLLNPFGLNYDEVTASTLIKVDIEGNVLDPGSTKFKFNRAGFVLHSAIHRARPDVKAVIHIHHAPCVAVSAMKCGLLYTSQWSAFVGDVSYHDYRGVLIDPEERRQIEDNLGPNNYVMILRNHGVVVCGRTLEQALHLTHNLVLACEAQTRLMAYGLENIQIMSTEAKEQVMAYAKEGGVKSQGRFQDSNKDGDNWNVWDLEFEAQMRTLDREGYRTGYRYRQSLHEQD